MSCLDRAITLFAAGVCAITGTGLYAVQKFRDNAESQGILMADYFNTAIADNPMLGNTLEYGPYVLWGLAAVMVGKILRPPRKPREPRFL